MLESLLGTMLNVWPWGRALGGILAKRVVSVVAAFIGSPKRSEIGRQRVEMQLITGVINLDLLSKVEL